MILFLHVSYVIVPIHGYLFHKQPTKYYISQDRILLTQMRYDS